MRRDKVQMSAQTGWTLTGRILLRRWRKTVQLARAHRHLRSQADSSHRSKFLRRAKQLWALSVALETVLQQAECRSSPEGPWCNVLQGLDRPRVRVPTLEQGVSIAMMVVRGLCDGETPTARRYSAAAVSEILIAKFPCVAVEVLRRERLGHRGCSHE